jgi:hypothetical protein
MCAYSFGDKRARSGYPLDEVVPHGIADLLRMLPTLT